MRIWNFSPTGDPGGGTLAYFDVDVTDQIRINGMKLGRNGQGEIRSYPPSHRGVRVANLAPALAAEITALAAEQLATTTTGRARAHAFASH